MESTVIEALKAKYPGAELHLLVSKSAEVIAKVGKSEVDMFRDLISQPGTKGRAMERFVRACIVHPTSEEMLALLERKPALVEKWGDQLLGIAGADEEVEAKKL